MPRRYRRFSGGARRPSSWRRLKQQFKFKRRLQQLKTALIVVAAVLIVSGVWGVWKFFTEPFKTSAGSTFQNNYVWDGVAPFNLLVFEVSGVDETAPPTESLVVVSLNPTQDSVTFMKLPIGYQNLRDLYGLGNLSNSRDGVGMVADKVRGLLGVPIDDYLLIDHKGVTRLGELFPDAHGVKDALTIEMIIRFPQFWEVARQSIRTNLGVLEIARTVFYLMGVRSDKIIQLNIDSGLLADQTALDRRLSPFFLDEKIAAEHLKIQVLNGSGRSGLAMTAARIVRNIGGEVIRTDNYERQDLEKGYLLLDSSGSYTASRLARIFGVSDSRPPRSGAEARANITVILGVQNSFEVE